MSDFKQSLVFAKTTVEKCSLWALYGFRADKRLAIEEIYKLNAKNPHIDYLLPKMIDEEEVRLNSLAIVSPLLDPKQVNGGLDNEIFVMVKLIAFEGKTLNPYLWHMASGYLSLFEKDYFTAHNYFKKTKKLMPNTQLIKDKLRVLDLLANSIGQKDTVSNLGNLPEELMWLYSINTKNEYELLGLQNCQEYFKKYSGALISTN